MSLYLVHLGLYVFKTRNPFFLFLLLIFAGGIVSPGAQLAEIGIFCFEEHRSSLPFGLLKNSTIFEADVGSALPSHRSCVRAVNAIKLVAADWCVAILHAGPCSG